MLKNRKIMKERVAEENLKDIKKSEERNWKHRNSDEETYRN
jgi:hypothetical protein